MDVLKSLRNFWSGQVCAGCKRPLRRDMKHARHCVMPDICPCCYEPTHDGRSIKHQPTCEYAEQRTELPERLLVNRLLSGVHLFSEFKFGLTQNVHNIVLACCNQPLDLINIINSYIGVCVFNNETCHLCGILLMELATGIYYVFNTNTETIKVCVPCLPTIVRRSTYQEKYYQLYSKLCDIEDATRNFRRKETKN